ncbi:RimJ/RimL family protein N-acetyltransferase [Evansella vedderi]|uniref:RimJ/RimL family protein N-acetyltransferase n=1 Tax=Evansella vedderi TaxID=38282 RepID=A0ABT9ZYI4_9BACI|nr:GNAT family protein [Evansella vedderi]MDQ0256309.1 RimJ/RimL family protein N-acetyltransferase [Evansella vedderi]
MIELRFFQTSDFQQLIHWIDSPEFLMQWSGPHFQYPLNEEQLENYLKDANKENAHELVYSVVYKETGNVIGHISLGKIDRENKSARIGKVLVGDEKVRGKGVGQHMITEMLKLAFDELKLHRVSLGVFDFNTSAIACYEKAGFVKEGLLRESRKMGDHYWSLWEMSILENEWLEKIKELEQRDN